MGRNGKGAYIRVHAKSKKKAKEKLRKLTSRSQGRSLDTVLNNLKVFMRGWLGVLRSSGNEEHDGRLERVAASKDTDVYLEAVETTED